MIIHNIMILNRKINIRQKSQTNLKQKSNNNQKRNTRKTRKNQKGGNYFLALTNPRIGGLAEVSFVNDIYAQSSPNINLANVDPNVKISCIKGGSRINRQRNRQSNKKGGNGNFSPDMNTRKFDCYQPNWSPDCV